MKRFLALSVFALTLLVGSPAFASHGGDKDCSDFASQAEAQKYWDAHKYSASKDPERLDRDGDGIPCEAGEGSENSGSGNDQGQDKGNTTEDKKGGPMPKTAISVPTASLIGGSIALIGGIGLLTLRRRSTE
jgi:LPXTG-motif cell wall-anchored protein